MGNNQSMKFSDLSEPVQSLVAFLVNLSLEPEILEKRFGTIGHPGLELPEFFLEFEDEPENEITEIKNLQLLPLKLIADIESFLLDLAAKPEEFWFEYYSNPSWIDVRRKAKDLISSIGLDELEVHFDYKLSKSNGGASESPLYVVIIEKHATISEKQLAIQMCKDANAEMRASADRAFAADAQNRTLFSRIKRLVRKIIGYYP